MNGKRCRTCFSELHADSVGIISLNSKDPSSNMKIWAKLQLCVPEIELARTNEEYMCKSCLSLLKSSYNFRTMCLKTEAKFQELYNSEKEEVLITPTPRKRKLTDDDLVAEACDKIGELRGKEKALKCSVAVVSLPRKVVEVTRQNNSVLICNYCRSIFLNKEIFTAHVATHFAESGTDKEHCKLRCERCSITFRSLNIYELHLKFMHPEMYGTYFLNDECVKTEEGIKTEEVITPEKPPIILKVKTATLFKKKKSTKCSVCSKVCATRTSLMKHLKVHRRDMTTCKDCKRSFVDVEAHQKYCKKRLKLETRDGGYKCPFCEAEPFSEKRSLLGHLGMHNNITVRRCVNCNEHFYNLSRFAFHLINKGCPYKNLPKETQPSNERKKTRKGKNEKKKRSRIYCPICLGQQRNYSILATHIALHAAKAIPCTTCTVQFTNISSYMAHVTACKRRNKPSELVIVKTEQENTEQEQISVEDVQDDLDIPELVTENHLLDPLSIPETAENGLEQRNDDRQMSSTMEDASTTEVIVQQINQNIRSIIEKLNSGKNHVESSSEVENVNVSSSCVESSTETSAENSNQVSTTSNESAVVTEDSSVVPSTSTMLAV